MTRLSDRTRFQAGDALELPFAASSFDVVWTIQMQMNIRDKRRLFSGIARVLRPGGLLVCQEMSAGNGEPIELPVPWASCPNQSHLADAESLRGLIRGAGLLERTWRDITADIVAARKAQQAKAQASRASGSSALPPLGMHLVLGEQAAVKMSNSGRNADQPARCSSDVDGRHSSQNHPKGSDHDPRTHLNQCLSSSVSYRGRRTQPVPTTPTAHPADAVGTVGFSPRSDRTFQTAATG